MRKINIDLSRSIGKMRPIHGVGSGPVTSLASGKWAIDHTEDFKKAGIPYSRLHDTEGSYGGTFFVDIPNIFPDFEKDAADPRSYNFDLTDEYIKKIYEAGTKVFYRLGVTIEHTLKKTRVQPPKDYLKWSQICEGIIKHYNEGWADGYYYNIEYWEIWNEPHLPFRPNPMWSGTPEQFYNLYEVSSNYLKERFPDIKIGVNVDTVHMTRKKVVDPEGNEKNFFEGFFDYITSAEHLSPVDFFDLHLYTLDAEELGAIAMWTRRFVGSLGFENAEIIIGEYNFGGKSSFVKSYKAAACLSASLSVMHKYGVDKAMYYDAQPNRINYCGLFSYPDFGVEKPFYSMVAFNELYKLGTEIYSESEEGNVYVTAARNGDEATVMITRYDIEDMNFHPPYRLDKDGYPVLTTDDIPIEWLERNERISLPLNLYLKIDGIPEGYNAAASYYILDENNDLTLFKQDIYESRNILKIDSQSTILIKLKLFTNEGDNSKLAKQAAGFGDNDDRNKNNKLGKQL